MRLFIAADLDERARGAVAEAVARLRARSERERQGSTRGVSWVDARNLHLTLHFLGEIEEARLPSLRDALAAPFAPEPPRISLAGWGVFPERGPARVIWVGVRHGAGSLVSAHEELAARLRSAGIVPDSRPLSPHLTVGRVKVPSGLHWNRLIAGLPADPAGEWTLPACTMFQSHLSPQGARYEALLYIPFGGAPSHVTAAASEAPRAE